MADNAENPNITDKPKKRKVLGSKKENNKKQRLASHQTGENCRCTRHQCFEMTSAEERYALVSHFNSLPNKDAQDSLLAAFVRVNNVKRRRPRGEAENINLHDHAFTYVVNIQRDNTAVAVTLCAKALVSIFGITKSRMSRIKASLASTGLPPQDQRGKHANRPRAFKEDQTERMVTHIKSFRGRSSHYSLNDTRKLYLPEDLNVHKMFEMYKQQHPDDQCCYESYRKVFVQRFNISFGYPRKDTCSDCDAFLVQLKASDAEANPDEHANIQADRELHLRKATIFYERKTKARQDAQSSPSVAAITFDFWRNLSSPNIATTEVYYRRQLSQYTFNVHSLKDNKVLLYCYDETSGKKGADDVTSMLRHYVNNFVSPEVTRLEAFCDSCAGQNKNWTVLRFLHSLVHVEKRFQQVRLSFPIKGHSFMDCDRDMICVNQKARVEVPDQWLQVFRLSRSSPSPFEVVTMRDFLGITDYLKPLYRASCPVQTRPLREVLFISTHPHEMKYRESWNGPFLTAAVTKRGKRVPVPGPLLPLYPEPLKISAEKYKDLQVLKRFCSPEAQAFFNGLSSQEEVEGVQDSSSNSEDA